MGAHFSSGGEQDAKLLLALEATGGPNLPRLLKAIRKGANISQAVYPGLHPSREPRVATLGPAPSTPPPWSALMRACHRGHIPAVQILLQQGAPLGLQALDGQTALMVAAQEGHVHVLNELLKHVKYTLPQPAAPRASGGSASADGSGVAAGGGAAGGDVASASVGSSYSVTGPSTVNAASRPGHLSSPTIAEEGSQSLSVVGAGVGENGSAPLAPRSASSFHPILDAVDERGQTALLKAAALGHSACMEALLLAGANVCTADHTMGMTALAWAAETCHSRTVALCLQAGANVNRKNHNGQTPLLCAASKNYDYLQERDDLGLGFGMGVGGGGGGSRVHGDRDREESKSMSHAVSSSTFFHSSHHAHHAGGGGGGGLGAHPRSGREPAHSSSPVGVVLTLLQNGGDVNAANHDKYTALMVAAWRGHSAVVELLIAHRANLDARAEKGQTALMLAAAQCHSRCAERLIAAGARLDTVDEKGQSALHKAALSGDTHTAECLVRAGADVGLQESLQGNSPLLCAASQLHSSIVELLLRASHGSGALQRNHRGQSALMLAAARGHNYTVACLVKAGAVLDAADDEGNTPLILAARAGSDSVVELLLDCAGAGVGAGSFGGGSVGNGASMGAAAHALVCARNHADESALDHALEQRHPAVVELLVAAGADPDTHFLLADTHSSRSRSRSRSRSGNHPHALHGVSSGLYGLHGVVSGAHPGASTGAGASSPPPPLHWSQVPVLADAVSRGLAARERYEGRERRYKDVVAFLEKRGAQAHVHAQAHAQAQSGRRHGATAAAAAAAANASAASTGAHNNHNHNDDDHRASPRPSSSSFSSLLSGGSRAGANLVGLQEEEDDGCAEDAVRDRTAASAATVIGGRKSGVAPPTPLVRHCSDLSSESSSMMNLASSSPPPLHSGAPSASTASSPPATCASQLHGSLPLHQWGVAHVLSWLSSLSLSQYTSSFSDASVDGETLLELAHNEELLVSELGVQRKIHRMKIVREIRKLEAQAAAAAQAQVQAQAAQTAQTSTGTAGAGNETAGAGAAVAAGVVPLSTSISNPLPSAVATVPTSAAAAAAAASDSSVAPAASASATPADPAWTNGGQPQPRPHHHQPARWEQSQTRTKLPPPSSVALFPAATIPMPAPSSASLFPSRNAAASASSSSSSSSPAITTAQAPASPPAPVPAPALAPVPASSGIFSGAFDFDNLANLAPLSSGVGAGGGSASSPSFSAVSSSSSSSSSSSLGGARGGGGGVSGANSAAPTPSGSGGLLPPTHPITGTNTAHTSVIQVRPAAAAHASEYSPMHQTDLVASAEGSDAPSSAASSASSVPHAHPSPPPSTAAQARAAPSPRSQSQHALALSQHAPRRIPYSELTLAEVIGHGQFGTVWRGLWRGASVAIKKLHLEACVIASSASALSAASAASSAAGGSDSADSGSAPDDGGKGRVAQEQFGLFMQEAALHQAVGNHPNLIGFIGISLPSESSPASRHGSAAAGGCTGPCGPGASPAAAAAATSTAAAAGLPHLCSSEPAAGDVCIVTHYFPLGSVRDLLITRRTLSLLPPGSMAAPIERAAGPRGDSPLPLLTLLRMLRDIACGVLHLHLERCIHRDLAARNFLVDQAAAGLAVRVADFGMSRLLRAQQQQQQQQIQQQQQQGETSSSSVTGSGGAAVPAASSSHSAFTHSQVGPLKWMSPESILRHEYSSRTDTYSFGVACWEVVSGEAEPYPGVMPLEAAIRAAHDEGFRPALAAQVPPPLARLMRRCWAHAPERRPGFERILRSLQRMEQHLATKVQRQTQQQQQPPACPNPWSSECWADYPDSDGDNETAGASHSSA